MVMILVLVGCAPRPGPYQSAAALTLRLRSHDRDVVARVARAQPFTADIPVDGEPVRFKGLRCEGGWAAVGCTTDVQVIIGAERVEPQDLVLGPL